MTTDLDTMIAMLTKANIEFERQDHKPWARWGDLAQTKLRRTVLTVERGYGGFASYLIFAESGELVSIEAYE